MPCASVDCLCVQWFKGVLMSTTQANRCCCKIIEAKKASSSKWVSAPSQKLGVAMLHRVDVPIAAAAEDRENLARTLV
jgi:hypothetical protein